MPADQPLPAVFIETGAGLYIGQVRPGTRFGVALTPKVLARQYRRQKTLLLFLAAKGRNRRPYQPFADMAHTSRATRPCVLFEKDHLLADAQATAAMLGGPASTHPVALGQDLFPALAQPGSKVLIPRATAKAQSCKVTAQVLLHPLRNLLAKLLICCAKTDIHVHSPKICRANCSR